MNLLKKNPRIRFIGIACQMFFYSVLIRSLLQVLNIRTVLKLVEPGKKRQYDAMVLEDCRRALNFFLLHVFKSKKPCLVRSIALYRRARMMGAPVKIVFGVNAENKTLAGHAWLEENGIPFMEKSELPEAYNRMLVYPS